MPDLLSSPPQLLWAQWAEAIRARLGSFGPGAVLQLLPATLPLPEARQTKEQLELALGLFFDTIPRWGAFYEASEQTVTSAYLRIIEQIDPSGDSTQPGLQSLGETLSELREASQARDRYHREKLHRFKAQEQSLARAGLPAKAFPSWAQFWAPYEGPYGVLQERIAGLTGKVLLLLSAQSESPYAQALRRLQAWLQASAGCPAPSWRFAEDPWEILHGWTAGKGLEPETILLSERSPAGDQSLASYRLRIAFGARVLLSAQPDPAWFNGAVLVNYQNGPWAAGTPFQSGESQPWGEPGIFPLMCTAASIVFDPKLDLELDPKSYEMAKAGFAATQAGELRIGPFGGPGSEWRIEFDDTRNAVRCEEINAVPQIIAAVAQIMPAG